MDSGFTNPIRTSTNNSSFNTMSGSEENPYMNPNAKGFRLLRSAEWSCAARYQENDSLNGAYEYPVSSGDWWTPGDYIVGDIEPYDTSTTAGDYMVYDGNSGSSTANTL